MKRRTRTPFVLGAAFAFGLLAAGLLPVQLQLASNTAHAIDLFGDDEEEEAAEQTPFWKERRDAGPTPEVRIPNFADLAERASPAVVNIQTEKTLTSGPGRGQVPRPFEEFFRGPGRFEEFFKREKPPSLGSGFVISPDGFILTNNHVVEDVDVIKVSFKDGSEYEAEIVGRDPKTDLALIRVEADHPLVALPLGDSEAVRPGEWVVAIGNPFGLDHSVTVGIISAKHRRNIGAGPYDDFLQTDAAINPGNSGGPLLNLAGEVIGINTAIRPRANTIGFAVPVNMAKEILPQLRSHGHVTRGWLGVLIQQITPELQKEMDLEDRKGALVGKVDPKGPASKAGLERGDVILEFDGQSIGKMEELPRVVASTGVGKKVDVIVLREGKRKHLSVKVGELEDTQLVSHEPEEEEPGPAAFGLRVQELTPELAEQLELDDSAGVVISAVEPGSPAGEAQLRSGDVILEVDRRGVESVREFVEALEKADDGALLLVLRGEATLYVALGAPE